MPEKIVERNLLEQFVEDSTRYAIYVTRLRAIPDYKDGLKPVQRDIIYCMYNDSKAISHTIKSASVVGRTMELYHPHGDSAIYGTMKPMANWFETKIPYIDITGNFGNFQGDPAAASRYTEVKLSKFALDAVIGDLKDSKQASDWVDTYDNRNKKPEFLPAVAPNLLVNGAFGIGVGMKVEIPRHNLNEVIDATLELIKNPDAPVELIPDHCMPCYICQDKKSQFKEISNKGFGTYKVRGIIDIGEFKGNPALFIKSIPDLTFLDSITEKIEALVESNKLIQIQTCYDKSTEEGVNYVIVLKKGSDPNYVREVIYKNTPIEQNCRVNFEVLDGINPLRMSYKSYLLAFIEFRKITKFRLYCNRLQTVQTRIHEREAFIKLLESGEIDNIIELIKKQKNIDDSYLTEYIVKKVGVTDLQAKYILSADLKKLSIGYLNKYKEDAVNLEQQRQALMVKITDDNSIMEDIVNELNEIKEKYGSPRLCKVISTSSFSEVPKGTFKIVITENNFIKKIGENDPIGNLKGDSVKQVLVVDNTENILLFDEQGKVFKLPIHKLPLTDKASPGIDIRMVIKGLTSNINTVIYEPVVKHFADKVQKHFMTMITENGLIKKLDLQDFLTVPPSGILYIKLDPGDKVKSVIIASDGAELLISSDRKVLRMSMNEVPHLKRNTKGNRSMNTSDPIDGLALIGPDATDIVVITETGRVNRFDSVALPCMARGRAGVSVIKLGKGDKIRAVYGCKNTDTIRITTLEKSYDIKVSEIKSASSIAPGEKMIPMKGDQILRCDIIRG